MSRCGDRNANWRGGRHRGGQGGRYWVVYRPEHPHASKSGYVLEHRLVMEDVLGRHLRRDEVVHHINGDPGDNRPENLVVMTTQAEHAREHYPTGLAVRAPRGPRLPRETRECPTCHREFTVAETSPKQYCSQRCYWECGCVGGARTVV